MPLMRLIFSALLALCIATPFVSNAEELIALIDSSLESSDPLVLSSARNIELELIPDNNLATHDLWERIRNGYAMPELESPLIARHEKWYANRPDYVARMTDRARRYLYHITLEVERRGMPSEIALLPMIESAFNPGAYSTSRASGIWQFIPSTGKDFGMKQNWWYDGRRNVISATNGALDYLQKLHTLFGDWELALAAYNWGEGSVQRAQERNRRKGLPTNYSSLKMPSETREYVPKLLAIKNIVSNPSNYGLVLEDIPNEPYFTTVATDKRIDVKLAAQLADISLEEFTALNPAHNRPVILQVNSDLILLPIAAAETFRANLEGYDKPLVSWQAYQPKKGERLDHLAPRFGLSVERLKSVNGLAGHARISTGQTLLVPSGSEESEVDFTAFNMQLMPSHESTVKYVARRGDTLSSVARRYHVSVASLKQSNGGLKALRVGQPLTIAQVAARKPAPIAQAQASRSSRTASRASKTASRASKTASRASRSVNRQHAHNGKTRVAPVKRASAASNRRGT